MPLAMNDQPTSRNSSDSSAEALRRSPRRSRPTPDRRRRPRSATRRSAGSASPARGAARGWRGSVAVGRQLAYGARARVRDVPETLQILQYEYVPDMAEQARAAPRGASRADRGATTRDGRLVIAGAVGDPPHARAARVPLPPRPRRRSPTRTLRGGRAGRRGDDRALDRRDVSDALGRGSRGCRSRSRATRSSGSRRRARSRRCCGSPAAGVDGVGRGDRRRWTPQTTTRCAPPARTSTGGLVDAGVVPSSTWRRSTSGAAQEPEWEMARPLAQLDVRVGGAGPGAAAGGRAAARGARARAAAVTFVNSLGLGDAAVGGRDRCGGSALYPTVGFKLDAAAVLDAGDRARSWRRPGCVRTVDFKGRYGLEVETGDAARAMYGRARGVPGGAVRGPARGARGRCCPPRPRVVRRADHARRATSRHADDQRQADADRRAAAAAGDLRALRRARRRDVRRRDGRARDRARADPAARARCFTRTRPTTSRRRPFNLPEPVEGLPASPLIVGSRRLVFGLSSAMADGYADPMMRRLSVATCATGRWRSPRVARRRRRSSRPRSSRTSSPPTSPSRSP